MSIPKIKSLEVIVIDDRSTDKIGDFHILKTHKAFKHIIFLSNDLEKKGAGTCRNIGIKHSTGDWVLFADSDDYFIEGFYNIISSYLNSSNSVVFFKSTSIYIDTGKIATRHEPFCMRLDNYQTNKDLKSELELRYKIEVPWSKLIKKEFIIQNNIIFEEVVASNDLLFSTKIGFFMKDFEVSTKVIYVVTRNFNSLTVDSSEDVYDSRFHEKEKYFNFLQSILSFEELKLVNISFLDVLLKSWRYGIVKFIQVFLYIIKNKLPLWDSRLFNLGESYQLLKRTIMHVYKDSKYKRGM